MIEVEKLSRFSWKRWWASIHFTAAAAVVRVLFLWSDLRRATKMLCAEIKCSKVAWMDSFGGRRESTLWWNGPNKSQEIYTRVSSTFSQKKDEKLPNRNGSQAPKWRKLVCSSETKIPLNVMHDSRKTTKTLVPTSHFIALHSLLKCSCVKAHSVCRL